MAPILLVIDLQHGIVEPSPEAGPRSTPNLTSTVAGLLRRWRHEKWPLIHVHHHDDDPSHPLNKYVRPEGHKAHVCSQPEGTEPILLKTAGSAFFDPNLRLEERLTEFGGKNASVVIIGMDGAQCINDNTRGACDRGFKVTVVADACATFGTPHYLQKDKMITAEETHTAAMSILGNAYARVVMTEDLLRDLPHGVGAH